MDLLIVSSAAFFALIILIFALGPKLTLTAEGCVSVLTSFGKYSGMAVPGASWRKPWERIQTVSLQNRSMELEFEAITIDQANVYFKCMLLFRVADNSELSIKRAAFAFAQQTEFSMSMQRLIEDETRTFVATQRQAQMIGISQEVVRRIQANVGARMREWGYCIEDLRYNNIRFDAVVTSSMARVVAAINERDAAQNEGEALLIRRTKEAEADGSFIKIKAEAEKLAWKLRGQGLADFRREVAAGIHDAVSELQAAGVDPNYLLFFMYTEAIKHVAENAKAGHTIFVDSNPSRPRELMTEMAAFYRVSQADQTAPTNARSN
jgi:regulator of protease activity HflC (stomatin/prohibitin superfamily)